MTTPASPRTEAAWNDYYAAIEHPYCSAAYAPVISLAAARPPGHAIDLGCGTGRHARALADMGWHVEAVDYSWAAIEIARGGEGTDLIDYRLADLTWWHPTQTANLVLLAFPTLPPNALDVLLARTAGWLKPDGWLIYLGEHLTATTRILLSMHFQCDQLADAAMDKPALLRCSAFTSPPTTYESASNESSYSTTWNSVGLGVR